MLPGANNALAWIVRHALPVAVRSTAMRFLWERTNSKYHRRMAAMERHLGSRFCDWTPEAAEYVRSALAREARILLRRSSNRPDRYVPPMTDAARQSDFEVGRARTPVDAREYCLPDPDTSLYRVLRRIGDGLFDVELELSQLVNEFTDLGYRTRALHPKRGHEMFDMPPVEFALMRFVRALFALYEQFTGGAEP